MSVYHMNEGAFELTTTRRGSPIADGEDSIKVG